MNLNEKAVSYYANDKFEKAHEMFQKAVEENRDVQSLHNLAWYLFHEKGDEQQAKELVEEAISLQPNHHFPYTLLGEIYVTTEEWGKASHVLEQAIAIQPTKQAHFNLAASLYYLGDKKTAATYFLKDYEHSDFSHYLYVQCLIEMGEMVKAKEELDSFREESEEFVGTVHLAESYAVLGYYEKAVEWFEKAMGVYYKAEDWLTIYAYSLFQLHREKEANEIIQSVIQEKEKDIQEVIHDFEFDEHWNEEYKKEDIQYLLEEKEQLCNIIDKVKSNYTPSIKINTSWLPGCYLFGCRKCNHDEYKKPL